MTRKVSKHDNMTSAMLRKEFARLAADTNANILELSHIVATLLDRDEASPAMKIGVFRWARDIARGALATEAALAFGGSRHVIYHIKKLPLDEQRRLASGGSLVVAVQDRDGGIIRSEKPITALSIRHLEVVFDDNAVRPFPQQREMLSARRLSHEAVRVRADAVTKTLIVGRARVAARDAITALEELGYEIRAKAVKKRA